MISRRRKKAPISKCILFVCSILVLNLAGISYAYWNSSGTNIMTMVSTGDLDVQFDPDTKYEALNGTGELSARYLDERTILIEGTVEEAVSEEVVETDEATIISPVYSDYEGVMEFKIVNKGKVPAELVGNNLKSDSENVLTSTNGYSGLLYPQDQGLSNDLSQVFYIRAGAEDGTGTIDFEAEFMFNQLK